MTSRADSASVSKKGAIQKCRSTNLNQSIIGLLTAILSVGTRNTAGYQGAIQSKINQVRTALENLRSSINALPNIDTDIETQTQKIASLQEQLRLKNELIMQIRERRGNFFNKHSSSTSKEGRVDDKKDVEMEEEATDTSLKRKD